MVDSFVFFQQAMLGLLSTLDSRRGMGELFHVLRRYLPLEAISFQQYSVAKKNFFVYYVVTDKGFFAIDQSFSLTDAEDDIVRHNEKLRGVISHPDTDAYSVAQKHLSTLHEHVSQHPRSYLVAFLHAENRLLGHLAFIGSQTHCFTDEHIALMNLLIPACALTVQNQLMVHELQTNHAAMLTEQFQLKREFTMLTGGNIVGAQGGLSEVIARVMQVASTQTPVLLTGEGGTGKELVANAVQRNSRRFAKPFIKASANGMLQHLLDSELLGHEAGAFAGAGTMRRGQLEHAHTGTLFIKEVGSLSLQTQQQILNVLEHGTFMRVGGTHPIPVDVRLIAATSRDLTVMCRNGQFREDLFQRLHAFPIHIPPLRERPEDIPLLIRHFSERIARRTGVPAPQISMETMDKVLSYAWPGNIRQLESMVERAMTAAPTTPLDLAQWLPDATTAQSYTSAAPTVREGHASSTVPTAGDSQLKSWISAHVFALLTRPTPQSKRRKQAQRPDSRSASHIIQALRMSNGKVYGPGGAAELLGVNHNTLRSRMRKLGIDPSNHKYARED